MKKLLNNTNAIIMIGLIGLLLGSIIQWNILFNHLTEANQKLDMLLDEKDYTVCRIVKINNGYYFVCDETVGNTDDL